MEDYSNPGDVAHCLEVAQARGFEAIANCLRDGLQAYVDSEPRREWSQSRRRRQKRLQSFVDLHFPLQPRVVHDELAFAIDPSGAAQSTKSFRQLYSHVNQFLPLSDSHASPRNSMEMYDSDDDDDDKQSFDSVDWYNHSDGVSNKHEGADLNVATTGGPNQTSEIILGDSFGMDETFYLRLPPSPKKGRCSLWCPCGVSFWRWCQTKLHNIGQ